MYDKEGGVCVSVCTRYAALLRERGQLGNVVCWSRRGEAGPEICIVGKVICNAWQVRQVGGHIDLRYLTQVWHVKIRLCCLLERKCHQENSLAAHLRVLNEA